MRFVAGRVPELINLHAIPDIHGVQYLFSSKAFETDGVPQLIIYYTVPDIYIYISGTVPLLFQKRLGLTGFLN